MTPPVNTKLFRQLPQVEEVLHDEALASIKDVPRDVATSVVRAEVDARRQQIMDGEMDIHKGYMKRLGISEEESAATVPSLDNLSYTSYMIRIAYEGGAAEAAVAILSCALSYEHIARRVLEMHPAADQHPFYWEWVSGYVSDDYHKANLELIDLTECLTAGCTEVHLRHLEEIFMVCSRYEMAFWDMAWEMRH